MDTMEIARFFEIAAKAKPHVVARLSRLGRLMIDHPSTGTFSFSPESVSIIIIALSGKNDDSYGRTLREEAQILMREHVG